MNLDVQWFIYTLVSNELITTSDAVARYRAFGRDVDVSEYAQDFCDNFTADMAEDDISNFLESMQQILEYAVAQAETGEAPDIFEDGYEEEIAEEYITPEFSDVNDGPNFGSRQCTLDTTIPMLSAIAEALTDEETAQMPDLYNINDLEDIEIAKRMVTMLFYLRRVGASDLHISAASPIFIRLKLKLHRLSNEPLTANTAAILNMVLLSVAQRETFKKDLDLNFALEMNGSRFRAAMMMQKDGVAGSYRLVPSNIPSLEELGFLAKDCETIRRLLDFHNGLILVTGPLGSGKTTTLASMVNILNEKRQDHVITVEDPIEIIQLSKNCQITQREVGSHTGSYHAALKGALREDPDIIVIGEMHDLETIENAITASETGHLVIGTLHTSDAPNTLNRILDVFPPGQQAQIRTMTSGSLRGIICQNLVPGIDGNIELVYEILINTTAVANNIGDGKIHQLKASMQIGQKQGMCTMDQCYLDKYLAGKLTYDEAHGNMRDASTIGEIRRAYAKAQAQQLTEEKKNRR